MTIAAALTCSAAFTPLIVAPGANLTNISIGDVARVHYTGSVRYVVASPDKAVAASPARSSVVRISRGPQNQRVEIIIRS